MPDATTVREAIEDDAEAVQRVARASWHAAYDDSLGRKTVTETVASWFAPENVVADVNRDQRPFFVAERDGEVTGFAIGVPDDDQPGLFHLYRIYVHPDHWDAGVGTRLLASLETELLTRGCKQLQLSVFADNERAVGFYESRGFERVEEMRDEQFDLDRYVYRKSLSANGE